MASPVGDAPECGICFETSTSKVVPFAKKDTIQVEPITGKTMVELACKHLFHKECIDDWMGRSALNRCPFMCDNMDPRPEALSEKQLVDISEKLGNHLIRLRTSFDPHANTRRIEEWRESKKEYQLFAERLNCSPKELQTIYIYVFKKAFSASAEDAANFQAGLIEEDSPLSSRHFVNLIDLPSVSSSLSEEIFELPEEEPYQPFLIDGFADRPRQRRRQINEAAHALRAAERRHGPPGQTPSLWTRMLTIFTACYTGAH